MWGTRARVACWVVLLAACGSPSAACIEGESRACACTSGRTGAQVCSAGALGPCVCDGEPDAGPLDAGPLDAGPLEDAGSSDDGGGPSGSYHHYVANSIDVPQTAAQAQMLGLDLDGDPSARVDNLFGQILSTLASAGIDVQSRSEDAISTGSVLHLFSLRAPTPSPTTRA